MSVLDELELRAQLEARRAIGPAAVVAWARARLPHEPGSRARSECVRAALVEALRVRDAEAVEVLVPFLRDRPRADDAALWAACEASPHASVAAVIAEALAACEASVDGLSILAGLREREARTEDAIAAHRRAISHAEGIADAAGSLRASLELARLLALVGRDVDALALATDIERHLETLARLGRAAALAPRDTLILARVELAASGRYQRARAIDRLADVVVSGGVEARAALRLVGRHLERTSVSLTAAEADRIAALLSRAHAAGLPQAAIGVIERRLALAIAPPAEREAVVVREAGVESRWLLERARAVRDGGTAGPAPERAEQRLPWLALSVIAHVRSRRLGDAIAALRELAASEHPPDPLAWTMLGRAAGERVLHEHVVSLAARWLSSSEAPPPARGYLDLAVHFERAGLVDLAGRALARARAAHEPEARALSIQHAIRRAWSLRDRGEIHEAHRLLDAALRDAHAGSGTTSSRAP
jgi:tetratricopeptide (TPR) repeat protein